MQNKLTDEELWEALKHDDENAFALLFDRYWSRLFTTAFQYIRDKEICAGIVHDVFLNIWQKRKSLEIGSFRNYLTAAARYHTYRQLRKSRSATLEYTDNWEDLDRNSSMNKGEEKIHSMDLQGLVDSHLQRLPKRCREIFILSRMENLSNDEIARRLQISRRTVENQLTSALRYFRIVLKDFFLMIILFNL